MVGVRANVVFIVDLSRWRWRQQWLPVKNSEGRLKYNQFIGK
jgi:hypothetical protein